MRFRSKQMSLFYMRRLMAILLVAVAGYGATCFRLEEPTNCEPGQTRCHDGRPEVCSFGAQNERRWTPSSSVCSTRGDYQCCLNAGYDDRLRHTCAPASACLPEDRDGGVDQ